MDELELRIQQLEADLALLQSNTGNIRFVAGCLRLPNPGCDWVALDDAGHKPLNIVDVVCVSNRVNIYYGFTAKRVLSLVAVPDEYYTQMGVSCGASVGLSSASIYFNRRPDTGYCDPMTLRSNNANVWVFGIFEV